MWTGIWYFSLSVLKCAFLMVEMKSLTIHKGSIINSLSPSGPMMDYVGGSAPSKPSVESPYDLSVFKSSSPMEGEVVDGFLSSLKVPGSFRPDENTLS